MTTSFAQLKDKEKMLLAKKNSNNLSSKNASFSWLRHLGLWPQGCKGLFPLHFLRNREGKLARGGRESISAYSSTNSILLTFISGACCLIRKRAFDPRSLAKKAERWRLPRPFQNDTFFLRSVDIITYHCKRLNKYLSAKEHMGGGRGDKNRDKMSITTAQGFLVEDGNEGGCSAHLIIINHQKSSAANSLVYREFLLWFWRRWREFEGRQDKVQASSFLYSLATLFKKENMSKSSSSSELLPFGSLSNSPENHELESCHQTILLGVFYKSNSIQFEKK